MTAPKLFYPSTDRIKFHNLVDQEITLNVKLKTHEDIDNAVDKLTSIIQSAAWASQSKSTPTSNSIPSLPIHIRSLITDKRRARARYQTSRLPSQRALYNKLSNSLKKQLLKYKSDIFEQKLSNLSSSDGSLWRETNKLLQYKSSLPPLTKIDNSIAITDEDKAETFRQHLAEIFKPHPDVNNPNLTSKIIQYLDCPMPLHLPEKYFTPNEIKTAIQKYSTKKTPGFDLITAEVARCLPKKAILFLTYLFNATLRLSYFPLIWKFSNIVMIPKPDKPPDLPSSYRPISLLPFLGKILERLILKRLLPYISTNKILPDSQFGFRSAHNTIHQVHRLVDAISCSLENKHYCTCAFLDISQAFDRVWYEGLLFKLKKFLSPCLFLLIKSYISDRHFQIRFGSSVSKIEKILAGVPQGGILSPFLFNIYTSDQPISQNTTVADYADDKAIISIDKNPITASANLQTHLNLMSEWYTDWRIKPNPIKSIHTTFTLCHSICPNVYLNNILIPTADSVRYLGLNLDKRLTWNSHIRIKRLALNARLRRLRTLLTNNKHSSLKIKVLMYKTLLKPLWTYGLQLWGTAKASNTNKIQQFQNIALRKITNAPPFVSNYTIHNDLSIKTVAEEAIRFYKIFHARLQTHQNPLIKNLSIQTLPGNPRRRLKRSWCRDLLGN